jgi:hypothetical protein
MKKVLIVFLLFVFITFISGAFFCMSYRNDNTAESILARIEGMDNMASISPSATASLSGQSQSASPSPSANPECPNMLIRSGDALLLYNSNKPEEPGKNPRPFYSADEYVKYLEEQKKENGGKPTCPLIYLQEEVNTQGENVFRVRPGPFYNGGGLPQTSILYQPPANIAPIIDASRDSKKYNVGTYPGFDPYGQQIGQYSELDKIHDSTMLGNKMSDNPMDVNWGGVIYTHDAVASGKYKDNEILPNSDSARFLLPNDSIKGQSSKSKGIYA